MQSAKEEVRDLERVRYVTKNFERLKGLRYLPFVISIMLWSFAAWSWFEQPSGFFDFQPLSNATFLLVCLVPWFFVAPIDRYYEHHFGQVRQRRWKPSRQGVSLLVAAFIVAFVVGLPSVREDLGQPMLGIFAGLFAVAFILYNWWPVRSRFTVHWPALAVMAMGVCSLPLAGLFVGEMFSLLMVPLGATFLVGLLMDHFLLVRTLKTLPEE